MYYLRFSNMKKSLTIMTDNDQDAIENAKIGIEYWGKSFSIFAYKLTDEFGNIILEGKF